MEKINVSQVMALTPCVAYSQEVVTALADAYGEIAFADLCALEIKHTDKLWLCIRLLTTEQLNTLVARAVDRQVLGNCQSCGVAAVESWATTWLSSEDRTEDSANTALRQCGTGPADPIPVTTAIRAAVFSLSTDIKNLLKSLVSAVSAADNRNTEMAAQIADLLEIGNV